MASPLAERFVEQARNRLRYDKGSYDGLMWDDYLEAMEMGRKAIDGVLRAVEKEPGLAERDGIMIANLVDEERKFKVIQTPFYLVEGVAVATRGKLLLRDDKMPEATEYALILSPSVEPYAVVDIEGAGSGRKAIKYPAMPNIHRDNGYDRRIDLEVVSFLGAVAQGVETMLPAEVAAQ